MKKTTKKFRAPDGVEWLVDVRMPGASNAMVVFLHPDRASSRLDRYNWKLTSGPEARDVTARLDDARVLDSLGDEEIARLFRRSMPISRPVPAVEPG